MYLGAGPLAAAAAALSPPNSALAERLQQDPAAFLAKLMDLRGSIALARGLVVPARSPRDLVDPQAGAELRALVRARFTHVRATIEKSFAEPFQPRHKLPSPDKLFSMLDEAGALATRSGRPLSAAIEDAWMPFGEMFGRALDRVRFEARALRSEIAPMVRAMGPRMARLEQLDATVREATAKARQGLLDPLLPGLARAFARGLRDAVSALPSPATAADIAPWFTREGFVVREIARGRQTVLAVLEHERGLIEALGEAAREGEAP